MTREEAERELRAERTAKWRNTGYMVVDYWCEETITERIARREAEAQLAEMAKYRNEAEDLTLRLSSLVSLFHSGPSEDMFADVRRGIVDLRTQLAEAIEALRVMGEETVNVGYPSGDRVQTLTNLREILRTRKDWGHRLVEFAKELAEARDKLREAEEELEAFKGEKSFHNMISRYEATARAEALEEFANEAFRRMKYGEPPLRAEDIRAMKEAK